MKIIFFAALLALSASTDVGSSLSRTFFKLTGEPLTVSAAAAAGWVPVGNGACIANKGIMYAKDNSGPSRGNSDILWFSASGQISAFGVRVWNKPWASYINKFWFATPDGSAWDIHIILRSATASICDATHKFTEALGDSVSVVGQYSIPLTETDAQKAGFARGACINGMGTHYSLDLTKKNGQMTWVVDNFLPVMPMYNVATKAITGVLIASTNVNRLYPIGIWEGPLPTGIMCMNWCKNSGCTFKGAGMWSTVHWMFHDTASNTCDNAICKTP
jgi:WAS/WASL-interacting protein